MGVSAAGYDPRRTRRRRGGRGEALVPRRASRRPGSAPAQPLGPVAPAPAAAVAPCPSGAVAPCPALSGAVRHGPKDGGRPDLVGEPLPGPGDAVLEPDGRGVTEKFPGEVVGGEVAADLAGPPGAVLDRMAGLARRLPAQVREVG